MDTSTLENQLMTEENDMNDTIMTKEQTLSEHRKEYLFDAFGEQRPGQVNLPQYRTKQTDVS